MITPELLEYMRMEVAKGKTREEINRALVSGGGWSEDDLSEAFKKIVPMQKMDSRTITLVSPAVAPATPNIIQPQNQFSNIEPATIKPPVDPIPNQPVKESKKIFFIILIIILLGILGGGAYAYYSGVFVSLPRLTSQAIDSARAAHSANYDITANVDLSEFQDITSELSQLFSSGIGSQQLSFTGKGSYDNSDPNNSKSSSVISVNMDSFSFTAEFRLLNSILYGVIIKAPTIAFFPMFSSYENKWISIPFKSPDGQIVNNPLTALSPVNPNLTDKFTAEQKDYIYKMSRDAHFVKSVKKLSPETVGGELSYHFIFDLDREGIVSYLQSLKEYVNSIGKDDSELSAFDPTSFTKSLDTLKDFKGEIWIGRNDKLLHKFMLNFGIQPDETKVEKAKINVVGIFSEWNQPVSIVAPAESIPIETFISDMLSGSMEQAKEKGE
jgi:hypothetical protein